MVSEAGVLTLPDVLRQRAMAELGDLERGALIGRGSFGRVYKGRWRGARPGRRAPVAPWAAAWPLGWPSWSATRVLGAVCPGAQGAGALGTLPLCACATWVRSPGGLPGLRLSTSKQGSIRKQKSRRPARPDRERGCVGRASGGQAGARPHAGGSPAASLRDGARPVRVARAGSAAACGQLTRRARGGAARRDGGGEDREPRRRRGPPHGRAAREPALRQHPAPQRRVHLQGAPALGALATLPNPNLPAGRARSSALWWPNGVSDRKARRQGAPAACAAPAAVDARPARCGPPAQMRRRAAFSARLPSVEASACRAAAGSVPAMSAGAAPRASCMHSSPQAADGCPAGVPRDARPASP